MNDLRGCKYFEPYAGGAGAALGLLEMEAVSEIYLNDADRRIFLFWNSILTDTDRFIERIFNVNLTIEEWKKQKEICENPQTNSEFSVGFAAFYMNRCNRSGVLLGAGPIGGHSQSGKWRLDVRFGRETLAERVRRIGKLSEQIHIDCMDAIMFLKKRLPRGCERRNCFVYLDPPYVEKGQRLYLNAYEEADHKKLSKYIRDQHVLNWLISYDDTVLVRDLYSGFKRSILPIRYTLQHKRTACELIISPDKLALPTVCRHSRVYEQRLEAIA